MCVSQPHAMPALVGLTGGIASGKSTVAAMFGAHGIPVIDADRLAREVVAPRSPGLAEVASAFGAEVLRADGALDRAALAQRVFGDAAARQRLEALLHPRIELAAQAELRRLSGQHPAYVLYEAALLVETGKFRQLAGLIVVEASEASRLARLMQRDGLSETAARQRMAAQLPSQALRGHADWLIHTDGAKRDTQAQVDMVHAQLLHRLQSGLEHVKP